MEEIYITRSAGKPPIFFLWRLDEVLIIFFCVGLGIAFEQMLICVFTGVFFIRIFRRYTDRHLDGHLIHMLYYKGYLGGRRWRTFPDPAVKEYIR